MASSFSALRIRPRRLLSPMTVTVPKTTPLSRAPAKAALHPASTCLAPLHPQLRRKRHRHGTIQRQFHPPSMPRLLSPSMSIAETSLPFRARSRDRRWASSIVVAEDESEDEDEAEAEALEEEDGMIIVEEEFDRNAASTTTTTTTTAQSQQSPPKKKMTKRQKRKQSLAGEVRFLHFREDGAILDLGKGFDRLAFDHDLSKFKWISSLEKSLLLKLQRDKEEDDKLKTTQQQQQQQQQIIYQDDSKSKTKKQQKKKKKKKKTKSTDRVRDYWKVVLKAVNNKKNVHDDLREHFLTNMVAGATPDPSKNNDNNTDAESLEDERDALLLAKSRELAVDNPLLWRRYSARERKLAVNRSKKLVQKRAAKILERGCGDDDDDEAAILAAVEDKSTSLDFYLNHVRIPALRKVHFGDKTRDQREDEARALQQCLKTRLPEASYLKVIALVQTYADCFGEQQTGEDEFERAGITDETNQRQQETQTLQKERQKQQKQFRVLLSNLRKTLPQGRIHWIGKDVANFFYVTTPDEVDLKEEKDESSIENDSVLGHSADNWEKIKDKYVHSFRNIRGLFSELEKEQKEHKKLLEERESSSGSLAIPGDEDEYDDDDDPSSEESILRTFDMVTALSKMDGKQTSTQRIKPRSYIPLEAMGMGDSWKNTTTTTTMTSEHNFLDTLVADHQKLLVESSSNDSSSTNETEMATPVVFDSDAFPLHPPVDRLVIIDNLPIDVTELRLREIYGRCGDIDAIQIFHARPDLDPGRRATDSNKKIRNASSSSRRQKWSRPRTPVYAMILFGDTKAATKASCDPLRIFGMVLDQHLARSHRACDLMKLYLEDVPSSVLYSSGGNGNGMNSVAAMELELNKTLETSDLYVYLDESGLQKKGTRKNELLSYVIRFPSFEAAYWSYQKLSLELPFLGGKKNNANKNAPYYLGSPALHWMETPRDSYLYWTRKLNF